MTTKALACFKDNHYGDQGVVVTVGRSGRKSLSLSLSIVMKSVLQPETFRDIHKEVCI